MAGNPLTPGLRPCTAPGCTTIVRIIRTTGGRLIAIDREQHPDGVVVPRTINGTIRGHILTGVDLPATEPAWRFHRATCTSPAETRRRDAFTAPRCHVCQAPMPTDLAHLEGWTTHPCCDPRHLRPPNRSPRNAQAGAHSRTATRK